MNDDESAGNQTLSGTILAGGVRDLLGGIVSTKVQVPMTGGTLSVFVFPKYLLLPYSNFLATSIFRSFICDTAGISAGENIVDTGFRS